LVCAIYFVVIVFAFVCVAATQRVLSIINQSEEMALGPVGWSALLITCSGLIAFILGISAENQKPTAMRVSGLTASGGDTAVTCVYPADPTIWLGSIAVVLLFVTAVKGLVAIVFPYQGKRVPVRALFKSTSLLTFTILSVVIFLVAEALLLWATILESLHRRQFNGKVDPTGSCPTAKTGLFGGAAFLALDSTLFWLVCLMLTVNARADHFNSFEEEDLKGSYADVANAQEYAPALGAHATARV
jgi:hypothetical protein